eukprot:12183277-Ditylum_brightwellii.AAC.1
MISHTPASLFKRLSATHRHFSCSREATLQPLPLVAKQLLTLSRSYVTTSDMQTRLGKRIFSQYHCSFMFQQYLWSNYYRQDTCNT